MRGQIPRTYNTLYITPHLATRFRGGAHEEREALEAESKAFENPFRVSLTSPRLL